MGYQKQMLDDVQQAKNAAGKAAASLVEEGMLVGLGTGTTAAFFIDHLILRCKQGLTITAVATSQKSKMRAANGGIPIADIEHITEIDMTADGADEIDAEKRMIKGGGGALMREKIIASASKKLVIIVDHHKCVDTLGSFPLPVEVLPFGCQATHHKIAQLGFEGSFRQREDGALYMTDNGNYIIDIHLNNRLDHPEEVHQKLQSIPGVLETGLFLNMDPHIIVGYPDGHVETR